ncbi:MAG: phytanoyl-CoA dioxygenase family protein [Chthonomonadales bacterium]
MPSNSWELSPLPTPELVESFRRDGYLKYGRIFTEGELTALREHVDEMIANLPVGARPEELDVLHFTDPWLFNYLAHPRLLDVIEQFIGPDIILFSSHFIAKPKGDGKAVPWHTDGAYWSGRLDPMEVITLWLAVDESSVGNGCMRVIPGSHLASPADLSSYSAVDKSTNVFDRQIDPSTIDNSKAVDLELKAGECHFHDSWTIHGSNPNHSDKRRCGYTMRFMPANVVHRPRPGWTHEHHIYLVRGVDKTSGQNKYTPLPGAMGIQ